MASMNNDERAKLYLQKLKNSSNPRLEIQNIVREINSLTWTNTKKPLTLAEKLVLVDKLEAQAKSLIQEQKHFDSSESIHLASDNSGVLDAIGEIKKELNK